MSLPINDSLDLHGWDLQKALFLLKKSNPTLLEWLHSSIIYQKNDQIIQNIIETIPSMFSAKTCIYHYLHMAQRNYQDVLKKPSVKLYLNTIRPILACSWIERYDAFPPNEFQKLAKGCSAEKAIIELVKLKKGQKGTPNYLVLNTYIETELSRFSHIANNLDGKNEKSTKQLDEIFLFALQEVWRINLGAE
ncbi:nucleotidyltransferase domain-containing protein [Anaerobacillus sp. CMMVII]|nr:nucleotidyltransferase domain-containing protein [Anaerobacillus sp. CMMVII]